MFSYTQCKDSPLKTFFKRIVKHFGKDAYLLSFESKVKYEVIILRYVSIKNEAIASGCLA